MWDWGAFPQKTPVLPTFIPRISLGESGDGADLLAARRSGEGRLSSDDVIEVDEDRLSSDTRVLSTSALERPPSPPDVFGSGGRLFADHRDPKRFKVLIEGRTVDFELGIVEVAEREEHTKRGDRSSGPLGGVDEVEDAKRFEQGRISFAHFMADETLVKDRNLILKWAGDK